MSIAFIIWLIFKTLLLVGAILLIAPIAIAAAIGGYMLFEEDRSPQPARAGALAAGDGLRVDLVAGAMVRPHPLGKGAGASAADRPDHE